MTGRPEEFEDRIRRVLNEAAGQLPARRVAWERSARARRWALPRPGLGGLAMAVGVAVVAAVVVMALGALRHSSGTSAGAAKPAPKPIAPVRLHTSFPACGAGQGNARRLQGAAFAPATGAPSNALLDSLAVLRRPARPSDRLSKNELSKFVPGAYVSYVRLTQKVAGTSYYLVPTSGARVVRLSQRCLDEVRAAIRRGTSTPAGTPDPALIAKARQLHRAIGPLGSGGGLCVVAIGRDGAASGNCARALPSLLFLEFSAGPAGDISYGIAPDGVAKVALHYAHGIVTATVVNNVYLFRAPRAGEVPRRVVWLSASGSAIATPQTPASADATAFGFSATAGGASTFGTYPVSPPKAP